MTMFFFLTKLGALLLVIAGKVTCADDFDLTCPSEWNDGGVEQLVCTIPLNKFSPSPSVCSVYNDTAEFKIVKGGNANLGCTVKDIDTACNNNINANGCGCQEKNATYVTLVYNIKAARNLHENSGWNCVPQCLDSSGNPAITATITSECSQIKFALGDDQDLSATQTVFICVGFVAVFAVTVSAIVFLLKKQTKVVVGTGWEPNHIIDSYIQKLKANKANLDEIANQKNCYGKSLIKITVVDNRASQDGSPCDHSERLHVLVSANRPICSSCWNQIVGKVEEFIKDNVTPNRVCFVPVSSAWVVQENRLNAIGEQTGAAIHLPVKKRDGARIMIEGSSEQQVEAAKRMVEQLIQTPSCSSERELCNTSKPSMHLSVGELCNTSKPSMHLSVGRIAGSPDPRNEPPADYPAGAPKAQTKYTGNGNGQPKKRKSDKEIPLSIVGRSSPPSETSGDEKTHMIPPTKERTLPVPANQHEPTSTGLGKSALPRLNPLTQDHSKMTSVERNSGAFPRKLPSPGQLPLDPIPSGKKS